MPREIAHTDGNGYYSTDGNSGVSPHEVRHGQYSASQRGSSSSSSASSSSAAQLRVTNSNNSDSSGSTLNQTKYDARENTKKKAKASAK